MTARAMRSVRVLGGSAVFDCARFMLLFLALDGYLPALKSSLRRRPTLLFGRTRIAGCQLKRLAARVRG